MTSFLKNSAQGLIFLIAFIPLYVNNSYFFPFITGKAFAFRIIVEILVALWLVLMLRDKRYAPKSSGILLAVTLFAAATLIANIFGLNPLRSIWSNFERMEGWMTIIHLWAYFLVTTSIFGTGDEGRRGWHRFFNVTLVAASLVGIYGFFQLFGWAEIHQGSTRIDASLGNAAYMAVYMLIHTFIAFYMGLAAKEKRNNTAAWVYGVLGVIFAFLVFATATRGTILGLAGGVMLALGIYAVWGKGEAKKTRSIAIGIIAAIILLGAGLIAAKNTSFVQGNETLRRLASISLTESKTQARGYIWPMAIKGIFESPKTAIIGVGQENFNYIFNSHYNPQMWSHEQWFDRAHNVFLDWLVAGGVVGFILYVSLFVFAIRSLWKSRLTFREKTLLTGMFIAYSIHNIFVFDNLASYILFFTMIGFVHSVTAEKSILWLERKDQQSEDAVVVRDWIFVPVIVIGCLAALYFINVRPIQANTRLIMAMSACNQGAPSPALFDKALALDQTVANQEIREQLVSCATNSLRGNSSNEAKQTFYTLVLREIDKQIKTTPNDARVHVIGGAFFNNIGNWQNGRPILEKAVQLSPNKQTIVFELATNYLNSDKPQEGLELLKKAYEWAPENNSARTAYATALIFNKREAEARKLFNNDPSMFADPQIINAYAMTKQYAVIIAEYEKFVANNPENMQYHTLLASAYLESGQKAKALAVLEAMKVKFPIYKDQIEAAIKEVEAQK